MERVNFLATVRSGIPRQVRGAVVAENIALHAPLDGSRRYAITQISSGLSLGHFEDRVDAGSFAVMAVRAAAELASGEALRPEQVAGLAELRTAWRGRKW